MSPGCAVTFTVLRPDGKPFPDALVIVGGKDWPYGQGRTDSTGKVSIEDLPDANLLEKRLRKEQYHVKIGVRHPWQQNKYWYKPDSNNNVVIRLEPKTQ